ncbi:MAG: AAA family ATPase, partial [Bacteroidales bacterium]|nr:AAA family ATPase [Bacteroidales bacterium]
MKTPENPQLQLAHDFVQYTNNNIFLTGKAGTGKTTFLHNLKEISPKRMVVVAPTGVAAINAGGVTIHSFFQLSFGPQVPGYEHEDSGSRFKRFSKEKRDIMKSLDLLVIDEISMVRADMLDSIDNRLRRFKNPGLPFGGVQLLMIGDLQQLAPVVKEDEWQILKDHYKTAFFFSSKALNEISFVNIELKHVYRQSDQAF